MSDGAAKQDAREDEPKKADADGKVIARLDALLKRATRSAWIAAVISIFGAAYCFVTPFILHRHVLEKSDLDRLDHALIAQRADAEQAEKDVNYIHTYLDKIKQTLTTIDSMKPDDRNREIARLTNNVKDVDDRLKSLEGTFVTTPAKAIETAQLQKELETLRQLRAADQVAYKDTLDKVYGLLQWILGAFVTVVLGTMGFLVNGLLQKKKVAST